MLSDILTVQGRVADIMQLYPHTRDDDKRLWLLVMRKYYGLEQYCVGYGAFEAWFAQKKIPSMESIRRCRQKIQEKYPHLRGEAYTKRHKEEKGVRQWARW